LLKTETIGFLEEFLLPNGNALGDLRRDRSSFCSSIWATDRNLRCLAPAVTNRAYQTARSRHTGGVPTARCDGSVAFLSNNIDLLTWQLLLAQSDGQVVALSTKTLVLTSTQNMRGSKEPEDALRGIMLALSELDVCPTGNELPIYKKLHKLTSELLKESEKGKPVGFDVKLKAIADLAKALPGDAKIEKQKSKE